MKLHRAVWVLALFGVAVFATLSIPETQAVFTDSEEGTVEITFDLGETSEDDVETSVVPPAEQSETNDPESSKEEEESTDPEADPTQSEETSEPVEELLPTDETTPQDTTEEEAADDSVEAS